jgi:hypothetical protein
MMKNENGKASILCYRIRQRPMLDLRIPRSDMNTDPDRSGSTQDTYGRHPG